MGFGFFQKKKEIVATFEVNIFHSKVGFSKPSTEIPLGSESSHSLYISVHTT